VPGAAHARRLGNDHSLVPLMFALAIDVYVVVLAALDEAAYATSAGGVSLVLFAVLWFAFPLGMRRHRSSNTMQRR
jgi:hypothetical protein